MRVAELRPIPVWSHAPTTSRRSRWAFKAGWSSTLSLLERELEQVDAHSVILAAGFDPADLRQDGWPRANARPVHPGIELSFDARAADSTDPTVRRGRDLIARHGSAHAARKATHPDAGGNPEDFVAVQAAEATRRLVFATDAYALWEHNVRAIALTLEALRAVDRYGTTGGRQYAGFRQLQAGR